MNSLSKTKTAAFTLIELLTVLAIIGILMALLFPAVSAVMDGGKKAKVKNDLMQLVIAIKAYQTEYSRLPTDVVSYDDSGEASQGWFQNNNDQIMQVLTGRDTVLNPRGIVFFEGRRAKNVNEPKDGIGADNKFYDLWGTPYAIKLDTSYNNSLEYYGANYENNIDTVAITISFGKNKIQQDPGKTTDKGTRVDDICSFQ